MVSFHDSGLNDWVIERARSYAAMREQWIRTRICALIGFRISPSEFAIAATKAGLSFERRCFPHGHHEELWVNGVIDSLWSTRTGEWVLAKDFDKLVDNDLS